MFGKKGSKILKLSSVRNCVTLAMTNKLVVIIKSHKVPKIKKLLLYEMKFLVPNYSCPMLIVSKLFKVKVDFTLEQTTKAQSGSRVTALFYL